MYATCALLLKMFAPGPNTCTTLSIAIECCQQIHLSSNLFTWHDACSEFCDTALTLLLRSPAASAELPSFASSSSCSNLEFFANALRFIKCIFTRHALSSSWPQQVLGHCMCALCMHTWEVTIVCKFCQAGCTDMRSQLSMVLTRSDIFLPYSISLPSI